MQKSFPSFLFFIKKHLLIAFFFSYFLLKKHLLRACFLRRYDLRHEALGGGEGPLGANVGYKKKVSKRAPVRHRFENSTFNPLLPDAPNQTSQIANASYRSFGSAKNTFSKNCLHIFNKRHLAIQSKSKRPAHKKDTSKCLVPEVRTGVGNTLLCCTVATNSNQSDPQNPSILPIGPTLRVTSSMTMT